MTPDASSNTYPTTWRKPPRIADPWLRWGGLALVLGYLVLALMDVQVNWMRVAEGAARSVTILIGFLTPDFLTRYREISHGILESLAMTLVSTALGIILSVPVGLGAARNLAAMPVYLTCRGIITLSRTFPEVIIAIFLVAMFGFGPFAGMLTLAFATIGFLAKLLAEDIEDIDHGQVEAIRATGASWWQVIAYGVAPQVMPRLVGLSVYRLDINFRESAVIGIVGAGGVGATLDTAFDRYEYDTAAAILIVIILIVLATEYASGIIRKRLQ
ncbi:phosphonate ABC transporter, permease protein PhnE [Megalodesulfovibrio paquesii]